MSNCTVVCEYNPFHSGHAYQISVARERFDNVLCIMSGPFVQSAMPAFCDKSIRAECAVRGGASAVIELPAVFATGSAAIFAQGAVKILSGIKDLTHMLMGATEKPDLIKSIADIKIKHAAEISDSVKKLIKSGKSYNIATSETICGIFSRIHPDKGDISGVLTDPNNILCLEYIYALADIAPNIEPYIVIRRGAAHGDLSLGAEYVSASAIRNNFAEHDVSRYIPHCLDKIKDFRKDHAPDINAYKKMAVFAVRGATSDKLSALRDCAPGLEHLISELASNNDYDGIVNSESMARYGRKRASRLMLDRLLHIERADTEKSFITRILACRSDFDFKILPEYVKTTNFQLKSAASSDGDVAAVLAVDERATALFNTLCALRGDYYNYSLIKL